MIIINIVIINKNIKIIIIIIIFVDGICNINRIFNVFII